MAQVLTSHSKEFDIYSRRDGAAVSTSFVGYSFRVSKASRLRGLWLCGAVPRAGEGVAYLATVLGLREEAPSPGPHGLCSSLCSEACPPHLTLTSGPKGTWSLGLKSPPPPAPPRGIVPKSFRK